MKQIFVVTKENNQTSIYGLGEDGLVYIWLYTEGRWRLFEKLKKNDE